MQPSTRIHFVHMNEISHWAISFVIPFEFFFYGNPPTVLLFSRFLSCHGYRSFRSIEYKFIKMGEINNLLAFPPIIKSQSTLKLLCPRWHGSNSNQKSNEFQPSIILGDNLTQSVKSENHTCHFLQNRISGTYRITTNQIEFIHSKIITNCHSWWTSHNGPAMI